VFRDVWTPSPSACRGAVSSRARAAAQYLLEETTALGMAVDTMSLDYGPSQSFDTHYAWLPTNRWGLENLANLSDLPANGATLVAGAPKVAGATGGPTRLIALV
jgi:kynurenine formamidase